MANHLIRSTIAGFSIALFILVGSVRLSAPSSAFVSGSIVIQEFRTSGFNGADDEFIELANISDSDVNLGGWQVVAPKTRSTIVTRMTLPPVTLPPGSYILLIGPTFGGGIKGDFNYGPGMADNVSIGLFDSAGGLIDAVATDFGKYEEGGVLRTIVRSDDWSYERTQDTDHNDRDFRLITPSHPRSLAAAPLSATAAATPSVVNPGDSTLLTVQVTSPPPISTGLSVFCSLSSIGGNDGQAFFDDGSHGDMVAGDRVFSYQIAVPAGIELGTKTLTAYVLDLQARSTVGFIVLDVGSVAPAPSCLTERFSLKTGTDDDVDLVDLSLAPTPASIVSVRGWPVPKPIPASSRVAPFETTVWIVSAILTAFKTDEDSSYRLILQDSNGKSIVVKIPCPCCVDKTSPFRFRIAAARAKFDSLFSASSTQQTVSVPVFVEGVGFFDSGNDQAVGDQNGAELHPVLGIDFNVDPSKPRIISAAVSGKKLLVFGLNFDDGAKIFMNSQKQKTANDSNEPGTLLVAKKAGKMIERGQEVTLTVKNASGSLSDGFRFTRPN